MATEQINQLAREELNKLTLAVYREVLISTAPLIDALLRDGIPYTKSILEVPNA